MWLGRVCYGLGILWVLGVCSPSFVRAEGTHTVRPGETWLRIAHRYEVQVWDLALANGATPEQGLRAGQALRIPSQGVVYVRPGQGLAAVADRIGCTQTDLRRLNHLSPGQPLPVGTALQVPGHDRAAPVEAAPVLAPPPAPEPPPAPPPPEPPVAPAVPTRASLTGGPAWTLVSVAFGADGSRTTTRRSRRMGGEQVSSPRPVQVAPKLAVKPVVLPKPEETGPPPPPTTSGWIRFAYGADREDLLLLDDQGRVRQEGLERLGVWLARELPDGAKAPPAHPRLAVLLAQIAEHFKGRVITLYSGFRLEGGRTKPTSRHVHGRAADVLVEGVSKRALWDFCRSLDHTGCGYYPRSLFVHVDAREEAAQWVDWSRPGKRARYGSLRGPYRRGRTRTKVERKVTRPDAVPLEVKVVDARGRTRVVSDLPLSESAPVAKRGSEASDRNAPVLPEVGRAGVSSPTSNGTI